jgi:hypothetical protein
MKITPKMAINDLRDAFLGRIFKNYPDHKKMWKAEDIQNEFSGAMYEIAMEYLSAIEKNEDK